MALAPTIESALRTGGILLVDELERELHPMLVNFIISKFQSKKSNPSGAQLVLTTHDSELYSISEFSTRTTDNIRKGYLAGKYGATPDIELEEVE